MADNFNIDPLTGKPKNTGIMKNGQTGYYNTFADVGSPGQNGLTAEQNSNVLGYGYEGDQIATRNRATGAPPAATPAPTGIVQGAQAAPAPGAAPAPMPGAAPAPAAPAGDGAARMQADWSSYWGTPAQGQSDKTWGGTLTRTGADTATYTNAEGRTIDVNRNTDFATLAGQDAGIANEWRQRYGFGAAPAGNTGTNAGGVMGASPQVAPPAASGIVGGSQSSASQLGNPTPWNVDPSQTVEGRINAIINPNNPLQQQARARSMEMANDRGMANTSMAITAGEAAGYDAAMPIAQADAATFSKAAGWNAQQQNEFAARNVESQNSFFMADKQNAAQKDVALINRETQVQLQKLSGDQQVAATKIQADNQGLLQTNGHAAQAFSTAASAVSAIQNNAGMDSDTKTRAIANIWHDVQTQLSVLGAVAGLNLTQSLDMRGWPGFDAAGKWVGFEDGPGAVTSGAAAEPQSTNPAAPGYTTGGV